MPDKVTKLANAGVLTTPLKKQSVKTRGHLHWRDLPDYSSVLLLQGPVGPFFRRLKTYWEHRGAVVHKVNFNPGDDFFYPATEPHTVQYRHRLEYWDAFIQSYLIENQIKAVFLFGDCRAIHQDLRPLCQVYGIDLWVLEEGYYRPRYFTLERNGVNAKSHLNEVDLEWLLNPSPSPKTPIAPCNVYSSYRYMVQWAILYWLANMIGSYSYPNYNHHRELNLYQGLCWARSFIRYWKYQITERSIKNQLLTKSHLKTSTSEYFLFPLQVHDDSQMQNHSDFQSVEDVIEEVVNSFYDHLLKIKKGGRPQTIFLIIKHHPMNRGHRNYQNFITTLCRALGIENQVLYIHDIKLPLLLPLIKGCITVNSTLGLQALFHGVPVINLGRSFYDKPGITFQGNLAQFWQNPGLVDKNTLAQYRQYVIERSQMAGCLYDPSYNIQ